MTITINTDQFIFDSLDRLAKQTHLANNYAYAMFLPSQIPSSIKKLAKGIVPTDFFNGVRSRIIVLKSIDASEVTDEDHIKVTNFLRTVFFLTEESSFSSNDVFQVKEINGENKKNDDNEEDTNSELKKVYFFTKIEFK